MARRFGWTDAEIANVGDFETNPFDARTRAALRLASEMTLQPRDVSAATFAEVERHFDTGQIVELVAVAGLFAYFNRFNNALRVEVTK